MPQISVLTGVCSETLPQIRQAVTSITEQTFSDWELLLVNDNPRRTELAGCLESLAKGDARIRILTNPKNLGLARSMNRAARNARGQWLARMDGDDLSRPDRLEQERSLLLESESGLVCSCYQTIDEAGNLLDSQSPFYTPKQLGTLLPFRNVIHHPTVLMRKDLFEKAGGYHPYPCAQDYDLWLRFLSMKVKMTMHEEPLLSYRIREKSTTGQRRFLQALTLNYVRQICRKDPNRLWQFSYSDYQTYLRRQGYDRPGTAGRFEKATDLLENSRGYPPWKRWVCLGEAAALSGVYRRNFLYQIQAKRLRI